MKKKKPTQTRPLNIREELLSTLLPRWTARLTLNLWSYLVNREKNPLFQRYTCSFFNNRLISLVASCFAQLSLQLKESSSYYQFEKNWAELTFATTSGTVIGVRKTNCHWLTGASQVTIPNTIAGHISVPVPIVYKLPNKYSEPFPQPLSICKGEKPWERVCDTFTFCFISIPSRQSGKSDNSPSKHFGCPTPEVALSIN